MRTGGQFSVYKQPITTVKIICNEKWNSKAIGNGLGVKWMKLKIFQVTSTDSRSTRIMEKVTHTLSTSWQAIKWLDALFHVTEFEPIKAEII